MPPCLGAHTCPPPQGGRCKSFCPPFPDAETQALRSEMTRPLGGRFTRAVGSLIEPTGLGPWHVNPKRHAPGGPRMAHGLNIRARRGTCKGAGLSRRAFPEWRVRERPLRPASRVSLGWGRAVWFFQTPGGVTYAALRSRSLLPISRYIRTLVCCFSTTLCYLRSFGEH